MNYGFKVKLDNNLFHSIKKGELVRSPGMKYKHYAPKIKCLLIYSEDNNKFIKEVNKIKKEKNLSETSSNTNLTPIPKENIIIKFLKKIINIFKSPY